MVRVRDARTTRAGSHAEVEHQAGAGTARRSVMQGCVLAGYEDAAHENVHIHVSVDTCVDRERE
eukprot:2244794-Prymnesium_polylepis.1